MFVSKTLLYMIISIFLIKLTMQEHTYRNWHIYKVTYKVNLDEIFFGRDMKKKGLYQKERYERGAI